MAEVQHIRQPEESWVDAEAVAHHLNISVQHVRRMATHGAIPAKQVGLGPRKHWRFRLSEVDRVMEQAS